MKRKVVNNFFPKKLFKVIGVGILSFGSIIFLLLSLIIGSSVKIKCAIAQKTYGGDCVVALITMLGDTKQDFRSRNSAIWALGQLGDRRALNVPSVYYSGIIPPKESLDTGISQYELKKAIHMVSGEFNVTSFIWRHDL
jgi:hypothetical protein